MRQKVCIIGASGSVGTELVSQIIVKDGMSQNKNPTDIIGIVGRHTMNISERALNDCVSPDKDMIKAQIQSILQRGAAYTDMSEILTEIENKGHGGEVIIVDVTAEKGAKMRDFHLNAIDPQRNNKLITANKNIVALEDFETFQRLTSNHGIYNYNTTAMAGAGVVDFIKKSKDINDSVISIQGCFSGTLGYIASELEQGEKAFSQIVKTAQERGYTEPNPYDDLNGLDVARKLIILARTAGYQVEMSDIDIAGFIDTSYADVASKDFMEAIQSEDNSIAERYKKAAGNGNTLKYIASMRLVDGKPSLNVGLQEVSKHSEIGALKGTNNIAKIETDIYKGDRSWILQAPGAGLDTTAAAMRKSIAGMLPPSLIR